MTPRRLCPRITAAAALAGTALLLGAGTPAGAVLAPGPSSLPLAGRIVGIDPGHNGRNYTTPTSSTT